MHGKISDSINLVKTAEKTNQKAGAENKRPKGVVANKQAVLSRVSRRILNQSLFRSK